MNDIPSQSKARLKTILVFEVPASWLSACLPSAHLIDNNVDPGRSLEACFYFEDAPLSFGPRWSLPLNHQHRTDAQRSSLTGSMQSPLHDITNCQYEAVGP